MRIAEHKEEVERVLGDLGWTYTETRQKVPGLLGGPARWEISVSARLGTVEFTDIAGEWPDNSTASWQGLVRARTYVLQQVYAYEAVPGRLRELYRATLGR